MKYLDEVRVTVSKPKYEQEGIGKGRVGTIILAESRNNSFLVEFFTWDGEVADETTIPIYVGDLELVKENKSITDDEILRNLPSPDPHWWCKVEDGFIKNLLGECKNKIPYDYES